MWSRLTRFEGPPDSVDVTLKTIQEMVIPKAKQIAGFKGGYWVVDRDAGKGFGFTLWESKEALDASEGSVQQLREEAVQAMSGQITGVEVYEVVAQA